LHLTPTIRGRTLFYLINVTIGWGAFRLIAELCVIEDKSMKKWLKSFVHNVIVHPLMQFLPRDLAHEMHDRNADWAFKKDA